MNNGNTGQGGRIYAFDWFRILACVMVILIHFISAQLGLHALYPVYCGPADALCWLLFYLAGYVLFSHLSLRQALYRQKKFALGLALAGLGSMFVLGQTHHLHRLQLAPDYAWDCLAFQALFVLTAWASLLAALAAGETYLNRKGSLLLYASSATFWWYLFHFPIVVIVAYYMLPLGLPAPVTFVLLGAGAFIVTSGLSHLWLTGHALLLQVRVKAFPAFSFWLRPQKAALLVHRTAPLKM
jgi:glucan biosynthesis protein C